MFSGSCINCFRLSSWLDADNGDGGDDDDDDDGDDWCFTATFVHMVG